MLVDNCRLLCQLDTLVLFTNRCAKLILKFGKYSYYFPSSVILEKRHNELQQQKIQTD